MKHLFVFPLILFGFISCDNSTTSNSEIKYKPTLESLSSHPTPEWYSDAKFGIFIHWGVYAVPAYHEWYVEFMSPKSSFGRNLGGPPYTAAQGDLPDSVFNANIRQEANRYHRENYGVDFAYDEFIPMFKAEQYDPKKWADLFKESGASYVVMTAKHGDEFALWDTEFTKRNAVDMGPQRDLVGDLTKEVRAKGMKMGLYHNTTYSFWDERYPNKEWVSYMNNSIKELVDLYQPDLLWGDVPVGPARAEGGKPLGADHYNSKEIIAYFYNNSKNPDEVVTNDRWDVEKTNNPELKNPISKTVWASHAERWNVDENDVLLGDYNSPERRNVTSIIDGPWETCDSLDPTSWGYNRSLPEDEYMTTNEAIDYLVDIVSKGGNLLLNIGPKADGTIPEVMRERLKGIGSWLKIHGEAIYGTKPWVTYGEGPTKGEVGSWGREDGQYQFQKGDVRFTQKGDVLYAIILEWPGEQITLRSINNIDINNISMLGTDQNISWEQDSEGANVSLPESPASPHANILKIERSISLN